MTKPIITAFKASPDQGRGLARDMQVRWAFEEVGQPYEVRYHTFPELKAPAHLALQPFGQIPTYQAGDVALFESGAIVLHIAEAHPGLLPTDAVARARAITWMFAALSTIEPPIMERSMTAMLQKDKPWFDDRMQAIGDDIRKRLTGLSAHLGDKDWLEGDFSAGDLMMVSVMRRLKPSGILEEFPNLAAYIARGEARPAFGRAFEAQLEAFRVTSAEA